MESLNNLGIDVSYVKDIRRAVNAPKHVDLQSELNNTGRAVMDLANLQRQRLSSKPPLTITKAAPPTAVEGQLAVNIQQQLVSHVRFLLNFLVNT